MKALLVSFAMVLFSANSFSAELNLDGLVPVENYELESFVVGASYEQKSGNIFVDVEYSGGCEEAEFDLRLGDCRMDDIMICKADVIQVKGQNDSCERLVQDMLIFPVRDQLEADEVELNIDGFPLMIRKW